MKVVAAILAAGRGERFGGDKTQAILDGKPLWQWSFEAFSRHPKVDAVGLVGSAQNLDSLRMAKEAAFAVEGGADRRASAAAAMAALPSDADLVLLHDAARPFVTERLISDVIEATVRTGAAAPAVRIVDTVKRVSAGVLETVSRDGLYTVQTPQGARREMLERAHREAAAEVTDDLGLLEAIGIVPELVVGDPENIKITTSEDLERLRARRGFGDIRTGMGYDVHPFSSDPSRKLVLGGVPFEGEPALEGHSDADVLIHAAVDALLGAASLGDIGQHFPNSDARWKNEPSDTFLVRAAALLQERGWSVQNLDMTVIAERPKVMARADAIRRHLAECLQIEPDRVNLKATTNERLGFIGRGEGIAALATATISR